MGIYIAIVVWEQDYSYMIMYEATLALLNGVVRQLALSFSCSKGDYVIQAQNSEVNEIHKQAS